MRAEYGEAITEHTYGNQHGTERRSHRRAFVWWRCTANTSHITPAVYVGQWRD